MDHNNDETSASIPPHPDKTPWVVYTKPERGIQIFCTTSPLPPNNKAYVKSVPQLCNTSTIGSSHDWLILQDCDNKHKLSLYNPVTLQAMPDLPPLPHWAASDDHAFALATLTCPPDHNNPRACVLFVCCETIAFLCRPTTKDPTWVCYDIRLHLLCNPVVLNGIVYFWAYGDHIPIHFVQVDVAGFDEHSVQCLLLSDSKVQDLDVNGDLIESCGRIYSVPYAGNCHCVKVWEFDFDRMIWVDVKCLDGRALFVGAGCSTWCWADPECKEGGVQENGVYFIATCQGKDDVYSCGLDNGCEMLLRPCQNLLEPFGGAQQRDSVTWFMPQYQRSLAGQERKELLLKRSQEEEESQIFRRVDDILGKLVEIIRFEKQVLTRQTESENEYLCQLPSDVLTSIVKKLPLFDYWNFRATCKLFRAALYPRPAWRIPLFIYWKNNNDGLYDVKDPRQYGSCSSYFGVYYPFTIIASSKYGWLLVKNITERSLEFVNLIWNVRFGLASHEHHNIVRCFRSVGFSSHPSSPDCAIVGYCCGRYIGDEPDNIVYQCVRERSWKHCKLDVTFDEYPSSVVYHKGAFYFMNRHGYLGVFKLVGQKASWSFYGKQVNFNTTCFRPESSHLVECDGDLMSVFIGRYREKYDDSALELLTKDDVGVKVFKCNNLGEKWVEVEDIGNYSLFIGPTSFSAVAEEHEMRNRIYLPKIKDNGMVYYSLETSKFHVVGCEKSLENLSYTKIPFKCCWV